MRIHCAKPPHSGLPSSFKTHWQASTRANPPRPESGQHFRAEVVPISSGETTWIIKVGNLLFRADVHHCRQPAMTHRACQCTTSSGRWPGQPPERPKATGTRAPLPKGH